MSFDSANARDVMVTVLERAWAGVDWPGLWLGIGDAPKITWAGRGGDSSDPVGLPCLHAAIHHNEQPQSSLAGDAGSITYTSSGLIVIQCKGPLVHGNGFEVAERMAIIARNAYRGKQTPDCIWFRNPRIQEVGADSAWYLFNTIIEFEYDEVG